MFQSSEVATKVQSQNSEVMVIKNLKNIRSEVDLKTGILIVKIDI